MEDVKRDALKALSRVIDPEVGLDVVTMGLVYALEATPERLLVGLTLTSEGCPLGPTIVAMAQRALAGAAGGRKVVVDLRWDPPWSPAMLSDEGRALLGR